MKMFWDKMYKGNNRIWGEEPSELAVFAVYYLKTLELNDKILSILDFCTRNELGNEFNFLKIKELYEHEYYEPHSTGEVHHHISWILIGESAGTSYNMQ